MVSMLQKYMSMDIDGCRGNSRLVVYSINSESATLTKHLGGLTSTSCSLFTTSPASTFSTTSPSANSGTSFPSRSAPPRTRASQSRPHGVRSTS